MRFPVLFKDDPGGGGGPSSTRNSDEADGEADPGQRPREDEPDLGDEPLLCRACGALITDRAEALSIGGEDAERVFFNPSGRLMEVITVARARNLRLDGAPTAEFTWFAGYSWQIALCGGCGHQLGWQFQRAGAGDGPARFHGLLIRELVEG